jgi:hypothetical protein
MGANDKDAVSSWLKQRGMPFNSVTKVELEGNRGNVQPA